MVNEKNRLNTRKSHCSLSNIMHTIRANILKQSCAHVFIEDDVKVLNCFHLYGDNHMLVTAALYRRHRKVLTENKFNLPQAFLN